MLPAWVFLEKVLAFLKHYWALVPSQVADRLLPRIRLISTSESRIGYPGFVGNYTAGLT